MRTSSRDLDNWRNGFYDLVSVTYLGGTTMVAKAAEKERKVTLDDLVVREDETNDSDLAKALMGLITLSEGQDAVRLVGEFKKASGRKKLVAVGLARHVMVRKGWIGQDGLSATTEWYAVQTQQKPKSVGEELSRLKKSSLVERMGDGWRVPLWALRDAIEYLKT